MSTDDPNGQKGTGRSAFDIAKENDLEVNDLLAETDGAIASMEYTGPIGYHIHVASGETAPEYLWRIALFQALDETILEMVYVDAEDTPEARHQLHEQLRRQFDPVAADAIAESFEAKLNSLIESQQKIQADD